MHYMKLAGSTEEICKRLYKFAYAGNNIVEVDFSLGCLSFLELINKTARLSRSAYSGRNLIIKTHRTQL